ncbi:MAG: DegT/DnrJ/EryC1/StrS family aminotransferase [Solirubrobacteraceae bacterium]
MSTRDETRPMVNLFRPTLGEQELAAVDQTLASGWLGRGPRVREFQERFAEHLGAQASQVRALSSCTEGLFLAMELLGVGDGDEVVLPTINFVGAGNAVAAAGARPVFCDVDPRTLNPRVDDIEAALTSRTRAILLIHYGGLPADIVDICALARERGIAVVEDSACSVASSVDGQMCGTFGDIAAWSFDAMKVLVTGDGGMIWCRDPELAERVDRLSYLGLEEASGFTQAAQAQRWWEFSISSFSRRSIMNDITAAMGLVQLERVPGFVDRRLAIRERYDEALAGAGWLTLPPAVPAGRRSTEYFYWLQVDERHRDALARHLLAERVYTTFRYYPLHLVERYGWTDPLPAAERAARETLCIPIHQGLLDEDVERVIEAVLAFRP